MPIVSRLTSAGNLLANGSFDENTSIAPAKFRTNINTVYAGTFDEFTGAPVVDASLQLWLDSGQTASYSGTGSTWTDLSGQSNTGTLTNSPTFSSTVGGGTFLFNGTTQTATTASLNLQQNFTLEAWVNQSVLNGFSIFGQGITAGNQGLHIWYISNTVIRFGMYGNDTDFTVATSTGLWYHMIFTYNHSSPYTKGFYLNAVAQSGTPAQVQTAYSGSGVFRLGATYSTGGAYGNGYFQGVKMYNRILTAAEITQNYNALCNRYGLAAITTTQMPVVSRQTSAGTFLLNGGTFDEFTGAPVVDASLQIWLDAAQTSSYSGSGATWTDLSGASKNGTLVNSPTFSSIVGGGTLIFNGTNQYVTSLFATTSGQAVTYCGWLYSTESTATYRNFVDSVTASPMIWWNTSGQIEFDAASYTTTTVYRNQWVHVALSKPSGSSAASYYVNGVLVGTGGAYTTPAVTPTWLSRATAQTWLGRCSVIQAYNRALSADEITTNFNALRRRYDV